MPTELPRSDIESAFAAVQHAEATRRYHARRTPRGSRQREEDLRLAAERLKEAMKPLRSHIGRFPYGPQTEIAGQNRARILEASDAIQRERRKLWKMRSRTEED